MQPSPRSIPPLCSLLAAAALTISVPAHAEEAVASIGKQVISAQELESRTSARLAEQQTNYERTIRHMKVGYERERSSIREKEAGALVDERVLSLEASARHKTVDALLSAVKPAEVTDAKIKEFYDANKAQMDQPLDNMKAPIKQYLERNGKESAVRAYKDSLRKKYDAQILIDPYREAVEAVGPSRGPEAAPVTIVEFSDFECPFCGRFAPVVHGILEKYPKQVRLFYRHLPLTNLHPNAQGAAEAAVCAEKQGKFWEMHDLLFAEQSALAKDALLDKAKRVGLDTKSFDDCISSGAGRDGVKRDTLAADQLGVTGTPGTFINGRFLNGAVSADELSALIEQELRTAAPTARR